MKSNLDEETRYKLLSLLEKNPSASQRELAMEMGVSVGKMNYCIKALIDVGFVKLNNFKRSKNKLAYAYVLTPTGLKEKASVTMRFLEIKQEQYEEIKKEIEELEQSLSLNNETKLTK